MPNTTTVTTTRNGTPARPRRVRNIVRRTTITTRKRRGGRVRARRVPIKQMKLMKSTGPSLSAKNCNDNGKEFIVCSLDPFGADSARVPDGNGGMSTHIKYTSATSFTVRSGAQTACIAAFPNLPGGLVLVDGQFNFANRLGTNISLAAVPGGDNIIVPFPDLYEGGTATEVIGNIGNIARCRVVSYGLEIKPVGAILNQGGVYCTANFPLDITDYAVPEYVDAGLRVGVTIAGGGTILTKGMSVIPQSYGQLQAFPGVKMCSGTESCRLVGKPAAYTYTSMEYGSRQFDNALLDTDMTLFINERAPLAAQGPPTIVGGSEIPPGSGAQVTAMSGATTDLAAFSSFWYDKHCDGLIWAAQDLSMDMSFEARFHLCVEIQISHVNSIYRPFISKAPKQDQQALAIVDEVHRQMPPSLPAPNTNSDWWSNITSAVTGVGDLVSSLDIPVVSQIGALASRFAKMFT